MAIILDINIISEKILDINKIKMLLKKYSVSIQSINSIDNWMWENERKIESSNDIINELDMRHIVIINLKKSQIKDMGVYIEKNENLYLYTLWINTEGYQMLDCEKITKDNHKYYKEITQVIIEMNTLIEDAFKIVGIGLETDIYCNKDILNVVNNSKNIIMWMLNKYDELDIQLEGFKGDMLEGMYVLQRK